MPTLGKTEVTDTGKRRGDRPVHLYSENRFLALEIKPEQPIWSLIMQMDPKQLCPIRAEGELS